jgi:hypothetical protein
MGSGTKDMRTYPIEALYLAGGRPMATFVRATRLFAAVAGFSVAGLSVASAQGGPNQPSVTVTGPSPSRPEFTRPAGIPGSARVSAANEQYLLAPAQPTDSVAPKKRKRR